MASEERAQLEIGFVGGQIMGARVSAESADRLETALANGEEGSVALEADDGRYTIHLRRVVYVKRLTRESRLGFSSGV
jgi:hypothetical protein